MTLKNPVLIAVMENGQRFLAPPTTEEVEIPDEYPLLNPEGDKLNILADGTIISPVPLEASLVCADTRIAKFSLTIFKLDEVEGVILSIQIPNQGVMFLHWASADEIQTGEEDE